MTNEFITLSAEDKAWHDALVKRQLDEEQIALSQFRELMGRDPSRTCISMKYHCQHDFRAVLQAWTDERAKNNKEE